MKTLVSMLLVSSMMLGADDNNGWSPEYEPPAPMRPLVAQGDALTQRLWPAAEWPPGGENSRISEFVRYSQQTSSAVPDMKNGRPFWNSPAGTQRERDCRWLVMYRGMMRVMASLAFRRDDKLAFHGIANQVGALLPQVCRDPDDYHRASAEWAGYVERWREFTVNTVRPGGLQRAADEIRAAERRVWLDHARVMDNAFACVAVGGCPGAVQLPTAKDAAMVSLAFAIPLVTVAVASGASLDAAWAAAVTP